jgi:tRNA threonylcarbamoyladenosine biosynthesis protein TsaE
MTGSTWAGNREPAAPRLVQRAVDEPALREIAGRVAGHLVPPLVLYLEGDLGTGKTTFVRSLLRALGHSGPVKSPTYGLMELYDLPEHDGAPGTEPGNDPPLRVLHLDLYRIADPGELEFLGLGDLLDERVILCVEWPEQGAGALPPADISLALTESSRSGEATRDLHWYAYSDSGIELCEVIDAKL